jgi:uncharacterized protein (DUF305 family)
MHLACAMSAPIFLPGAPGHPGRQISAAESLALAHTSISPDDVQFVRDMIHHHSQAVLMVELLRTRTARTEMRLLGRRIGMSQASEIELMRSWLVQQHESAEEHEAHSMGHALMTGMLSGLQMSQLASSTGVEFDRLFLTGMIQHHKGALQMVRELTSKPGTAEDAALSDLVVNIVADQTAEIQRMSELLPEYGADDPSKAH